MDNLVQLENSNEVMMVQLIENDHVMIDSNDGTQCYEDYKVEIETVDEPLATIPESTTFPESEPNQLNNWSDQKMDLMLSLYLKLLDKFRDPLIRKKDLWKKIASRVGCSPESCDRKFRNAKHRFLQIARQGNKRQVTKWPHFQKMVEIFKGDPTILDVTKFSVKKESVSANAPPVAIKRKRYLGPDEVKVRKIDHGNEIKVVLRKQDLIENMNERQEEICHKLDELITKVQESNVIQRKRNDLFEKYIETLARQKMSSRED